MKKILFICSHPYSGSSALYESLNLHPKIQGFKPFNKSNSYLSPANILDLTNRTHKMSNRSAIYMDELLFNNSFYTSSIYEKCKFIYVLREPEIPLNFLIANEKRKSIFVTRQYTFRLRRLCEMAKRTPGAIFLTWNDLLSSDWIPLVEKYLGVKNIEYDLNFLSVVKKNFITNLIDNKLLLEAQNAYENYLYFLKNQNLIYLR